MADMRDNNQHLDAHTRDRYALGFISDEHELARIQTHVKSCTDCRQALETESDFARAVRVAKEEVSEFTTQG
jgi:hypothetical protein